MSNATMPTIGKDAVPQAVGYNNLIPLRFPSVTLAGAVAPSAVSGRIPMGVAARIMAVSYVMSGSTAGTVSMNVSLGSGSYETAGAAPAAHATFGGTWASNESFTIEIGTVTQKFVVTSRTAGNNAKLAAETARVINAGSLFGTGVYAYALGSVVYFVLLQYATAGNSTAFVVTLNSASGTLVASGATFAGGSAGTLPSMPNLNSFPNLPIASDGEALFPVDIPLAITADQVGVLYPVQPGNFDAIWPSADELTLRLDANSSAAGVLDVILWAVPFDVNRDNPQNLGVAFSPAYNIL